MIGVWSFWSKPYVNARKQIWATEQHHLLSWVLSHQLARPHFRQTCLVTDAYGAHMLVDQLGLAFDDVHIVLNTLDQHDTRWWALGKLYAYRMQQQPFIHIDSDVYLWKKLPVSAQAAVIAQSPEYFFQGESFYKPDAVLELRRQHQGWLPEEWHWYQAQGRVQRAECCGIFGGSDIAFINYYADLAIRTIEHDANKAMWRTLDDNIERNILLEQYLLSACMEYRNNRTPAPMAIDYVFGSESDAFNREKSAAAGYTHLIADTKKDPTVADHLARKVEKLYPEQYQRCMDFKALA